MSEKSKTQIVEINGVKLEVDTRTAKRVDKFRIGDTVKVLIEKYENDHKVYPGVIIGFEQFQKLPTIVVAYLDITYSEAELKFVYINAENKKAEITKSCDDYIPIEKDEAIRKFDKEIEEARATVQTLEQKKKYFLKRFGEYFKT